MQVRANKNVTLQLLCAIFVAAPTAGLSKPKTKNPSIKVCDDAAGWAPIVFKDKNSKHAADGIAPKIFYSIIKNSGLKATKVRFLPWRHAIHDLEEKNTKCDIILGATLNKERREKFYYTKSYFTITPGYFYFKSRFPRGFPPHRPEDLMGKKICGVDGWNYEPFGINNWRNVIDSSTKTVASLVNKTRHGYCDVFLERYEIISGTRFTGKDLLSDKDIKFEFIKGAKKDSVHMLISKRSMHATELVKILNKGITDYSRNGKLDNIKAPYK